MAQRCCCYVTRRRIVEFLCILSNQSHDGGGGGGGVPALHDSLCSNIRLNHLIKAWVREAPDSILTPGSDCCSQLHGQTPSSSSKTALIGPSHRQTKVCFILGFCIALASSRAGNLFHTLPSWSNKWIVVSLLETEAFCIATVCGAKVTWGRVSNHKTE